MAGLRLGSSVLARASKRAVGGKQASAPGAQSVTACHRIPPRGGGHQWTLRRYAHAEGATAGGGRTSAHGGDADSVEALDLFWDGLVVGGAVPQPGVLAGPPREDGASVAHGEGVRRVVRPTALAPVMGRRRGDAYRIHVGERLDLARLQLAVDSTVPERAAFRATPRVDGALVCDA
eukprot:scaffold2497_cov119-Isochrysis_galbana.AAC.3